MTSVPHPALTSAVPARGRALLARPAWWTTVARWAAIDLACWAALTMIVAGQSWVSAGISGNRVTFSDALVDQIEMWVPCALLAPLAVLVALRARVVGRQRAIAIHAGAAIGFALVGGAIMGLLEWALPSTEIQRSMWTVVGRDVVGGLTSFILIYGLIVAAVQAVAYGRESRERQVAAARLQRELAEARLDAVTTQLQPHFLFNTLNAVAALVRSDPTQAERTIARLSDLLRYALASVDDGLTTLHDEVRFLTTYVEIQRARFGERLGVTMAVDPAAERAVVPRLLLQPIVENAIRHGISPRAAPGHIAVQVRREGDQLRIAVRDDGVGLPASGSLREGVGLTATRARLRQEYADDHEFTLGPAPGGGTLATLRIPFRPDRDARPEGRA